jgi:hypothetical protein
MEDFVWRIENGLYSMHQSRCVWYKMMDGALEEWGFTCLPLEPCGYRRMTDEGTLDPCVHVDDFLYIATSDAATQRFLKEMGEWWQFVDLGKAKLCIGIAFIHDWEHCLIGLSQELLIDKIVSTFLSGSPFVPLYTPMDSELKLSCSPADKDLSPAELHCIKALLYHLLVGSMMYVAVGSYLDISYAISKLAQFLDCYHEVHFDTALWCAHYLVTTCVMKLWLGGESPVHLVGCNNSSYVDCLDTHHSSMGYCFSLGSGVILWNMKKQKMVSCSTTEAKYIAVGEATHESLWLRQQLLNRGSAMPAATVVFCDNNGALTLAHDLIHHSCNKHINIRSSSFHLRED